MHHHHAQKTEKNKTIEYIINLRRPLISMVTGVFMALLLFYGVLCSLCIWPLTLVIISTEDEIGALYLEYFTNNINGEDEIGALYLEYFTNNINSEDEIGALYLEYFTNNINGCQITKEGGKKRLVI